METENLEMHSWALRNSLNASDNRRPETFISDRDRALIAAVKEVFPFAFHAYCIYHIMSNIDKNLPRLATPWLNFQSDFWTAFQAVSPEFFEKLWALLC
jgi:transposase-like protein